MYSNQQNLYHYYDPQDQKLCLSHIVTFCEHIRIFSLRQQKNQNPSNLIIDPFPTNTKNLSSSINSPINTLVLNENSPQDSLEANLLGILMIINIICYLVLLILLAISSWLPQLSHHYPRRNKLCCSSFKSIYNLSKISTLLCCPLYIVTY